MPMETEAEAAARTAQEAQTQNESAPPAAAEPVTMDQVNAAIAAALQPVADEVREILTTGVGSLGDEVKAIGDGLSKLEELVATMDPAKAGDVVADLKKTADDVKQLLADVQPILAELPVWKKKLAGLLHFA